MTDRKYSQTITHWARSAPDGFGAYTYAAPVQLAARWEDQSEEVSNEDTDLRRLRSVIWTEQPLAVGDYVFLGVSAEANPAGVHDAFEVRKTRAIPSVDGGRFEHVAMI